MMSIQALLSSPSAESGINLEALKQMRDFPEEHRKTAAFWTYAYAVAEKTGEMASANAPLEGSPAAAAASLTLSDDNHFHLLSLTFQISLVK